MCKGASFILSVNPDSYGFQNVILCFSTKVYIYTCINIYNITKHQQQTSMKQLWSMYIYICQFGCDWNLGMNPENGLVLMGKMKVSTSGSWVFPTFLFNHQGSQGIYFSLDPIWFPPQRSCSKMQHHKRSQIDLNGSFPNIKDHQKVEIQLGWPRVIHQQNQVSRASEIKASKLLKGDSMSVKDITDGTATCTATPNLSHVAFWNASGQATFPRLP